MTRVFVTGGSGFIGKHLVARLLAEQCAVREYNAANGDNLCDSLRLRHAIDAFRPNLVYHLAAHANVREAEKDAALVFETNTRGTFNLLEAMRQSDCKARRILFASSCSVYGEPDHFPSYEYASFMPVQTSLYGASKLAGEALCQAYSTTFGFETTIMRMVSILGEGCHRGHVVDLYRKLKENPACVTVKGNGTQSKSYLYVGDCIEAMWRLGRHQGVFNVGLRSGWTVNQSLDVIEAFLGIHPIRVYDDAVRGWVGDAPRIEPDTTLLRKTGWRPKVAITEAIKRTLEDLRGR